MCLSTGGQQTTRRYSGIGAFDAHILDLAQRSRMLDQPRGGLAEHHPTGWRDRLHPLGHSDLLAYRGVTHGSRSRSRRLSPARNSARFVAATRRRRASGPPRQASGLLLDAQRRETCAKRMVFQRGRRTENRHDSVTGELVHGAAVPLHHQRERSTNCVMISRSRSAPTAAAISIDRTTSANMTVTCLYSASSEAAVTGEPHPSQNRACSRSRRPHARHDPAAIRPSAADPSSGRDYGFANHKAPWPAGSPDRTAVQSAARYRRSFAPNPPDRTADGGQFSLEQVGKKGAAMAWKLQGTYVETCSCEFFCPCNFNLANGADYDRCRVTLVFNITDGDVDGNRRERACRGASSPTHPRS